MFDDFTPRYAPERVVCQGKVDVPVRSYRAYPKGQHPQGCPLVPDCTALEMVTEHGSRWYGCERAYINSELRMVVVGINSRDTVRKRWAICKVA